MDRMVSVNSSANEATVSHNEQDAGHSAVQAQKAVVAASQPNAQQAHAAPSQPAHAVPTEAELAAVKVAAANAAAETEEVLAQLVEDADKGREELQLAAAEEAEVEADVVETAEFSATAPAIDLTSGLTTVQFAQAGKPARQGVDGDTSLGQDDEDGGISGVLIGVLALVAIGGGIAVAAGGGNKESDLPSNSPPVAGDDALAATEGSGTVNLSVTANDSDPDGNTLTYTANGTLPVGVTLSAAGAVTFDSNNAEYNSLAAGATRALTFSYTVNDGNGGTDTANVTLTVTGANDAPVAVADTATATEDAPAVTGSVATNDSDVDAGTTLTYALAAPVAGLTLNANGTYSFDPSNAAYQSLAAGATQVVVANYTVSDGAGGTATSTLTITLTGVNDAPVAVAAVAAATEGASAAVTGTVTATDVDTPAGELTYALVAPVAGLTLNANGTYSFDPANAAYDSLAAGQVLPVVANFTVSDGKGGTSTSTLTINVTGTNDAPVITSGATAIVAENAPATTVVYDAAATDVDASDTVRFSLSGTNAGLFTIDSSTGEVRLVAPANFERQSSLTVTVVATDSVTPALSASRDVTVTITDQVDVASLDVGNVGTPVTINAGIQTGDTLDTNFRLNETSGAESEVRITNFGANDFIFFDGFDPADYTFQNDGAGNLTISRVDSTTDAVNVITLVGTGISSTAIIVTEADAEAALGAVLGAGDYFRGSAASTTIPATGTTIDASGRSATIVEDLRTLSETVITNFRSDDVLQFINGLEGEVGFTTGTDPRDLRIDYVDPETGNVSTVIIDNVLRADGPIVSDEASAEAAVALVLGAGDYFQFG